MLREEAFLDTAKLEALGPNIALGVTRPVKSASNPIWPVLASDGSVPDWGVGFHSLHQVGAVTRMFFAAFEGPSINYVQHGYAQIAEDLTVTRPNVGAITFNGNTNNDLITPGGYTRNQFFTTWDETTNQYICFVIAATSPSRVYKIYTSPTMPPTWTLRKTLTATQFGLTYMDGSNIWRRSDGRLAMYYQDIETVSPAVAYAGFVRHVGMLLGPSDGSITGTWTNVGRVLSAASVNDQHYYPGAWVDGELVYVPTCIFDGDPAGPPSGHTISGTRNCIYKVKLHVGRANDGSALSLVDSAWVSRGSPGDWDGGEIGTSQNIVEIGDEWRISLWGDEDTHHQTPELSRRTGMATLGRRRIGYIVNNGASTDTVRTTTITAAVGGEVTINSTGTVQVELLDASNNVIPGFERSACDTIPSSTFGHTVTWGGNAYTPAVFKAKFYLAPAARVHYLTAAESAGRTLTPATETDTAQALTYGLRTAGLTLDPDPYWQQSGTALTVHAAVGRRREVTGVVTSSTGGPLRFAGTDAASFEVSLNGTDWASSIDIPVGDTPIWLSAEPDATGALVAEVGVPA